MILRDLLTGITRFGQLKKSIDFISQKVLTENLRSMEENKIIVREVFNEVPPRVEYKLSTLGNSLRPIISAMQDWGVAYLSIKKDNL